MSLDPDTLSTLAANPLSWVLTLVLALGGWKALVALRRDWGHDRPLEDVTVTEAVRRVASAEVARIETRLREVERRLDEVLAELEAEQRGRARERRRADDAEARVEGLLSHLTVLHEWITTHVPDAASIPPVPGWLRASPTSPP